jgi:hypothetical protein
MEVMYYPEAVRNMHDKGPRYIPHLREHELIPYPIDTGNGVSYGLSITLDCEAMKTQGWYLDRDKAMERAADMAAWRNTPVRNLIHHVMRWVGRE